MIPLVIDSNIFFSAIYNPEGIERKILQITIEKEELKLFSPDVFWEEIERNFIKKLGYSKKIINELFSKFNIIEVSIDDYTNFIKKAELLVNHENDVPFVAVALYLNCPLWSGNEKHFGPLKDLKEFIWFNSRNLMIYLKDKNLIEINEVETEPHKKEGKQ